MDITVKTSLPTRTTNQKCGRKIGLAGMLCHTNATFKAEKISFSFLYLVLCFLFFRYTDFGTAVPYRPAEDLAFSVARFVQNRGSYVNYYMVFLRYPSTCLICYANLCSRKFDLSLIISYIWVQYHGGTNFGRTSSGLFIATSYDYDAPIDEYGMQ